MSDKEITRKLLSELKWAAEMFDNISDIRRKAKERGTDPEPALNTMESMAVRSKEWIQNIIKEYENRTVEKAQEKGQKED